MQTRRFYVPNIPEEGGEAELPPAEALHAGRVLRLRPGDSLTLLDGHGGQAEATIEDPGRGRRFAGMTYQVKTRTTVPLPAMRCRLCIAPPRPKQMSAIVRSATELGVWSIAPIATEYGVAQPRAAAVEGWTEDAVAALKQSGNPFLPTIEPLRPFADVLAEAPRQCVYGAVPEPGRKSTMPGLGEGDVDVWIGPEGGFTEGELAAFQEREFYPLSLGRWVLRVETAVPALLGALLWDMTS